MNDLIANNPLIIPAVCSAVIFCYIALCLLKIKKYESEDKGDINNFCISLKYNKDLVYYVAVQFGVLPSTFMVIASNQVNLMIGVESIKVVTIVALVTLVGVMVCIESIRKKLIIRENQITHVTFFGIKEVFDFESIRKVELFSQRTFLLSPQR